MTYQMSDKKKDELVREATKRIDAVLKLNGRTITAITPTELAIFVQIFQAGASMAFEQVESLADKL